MTIAPRRPLLAGKVAIVTGASRGIGAVAARALAEAGAAVALAARDEAALTAGAEQIAAAGGRALAVPTDVTDAASIEGLVARTIDAYGRLDAAFNNAGDAGHLPTPLAEVSIDEFDSALAVGLRGVFLSMKCEIPAMLRGGGGAIVNMSSTAGIEAVAGLAGYVSSKHGVIGLTKAAALDYADHGIRVNAVAPGPILTHRLRQAGEEAQRQAALAMPMRRLGRAEEVAAAVVWLCSDDASYVTGATLPIDGGKLAGASPFGSRGSSPGVGSANAPHATISR
jgi:NAD(P)-dependent dehydrogenase (short-subunit alcohol dehydrogenase family)